ncbi:MAG TPA: MFS transporter [Actinomycetota bacterium]|jgi:MFS family permease|nr:MFS transporter [Actinomycetota bacterium]
MATPERPRLVTPAFFVISAGSLAYFLSLGILVPAVPLYVAGPLQGGEVAVGLAVGVFSVSGFLFRPWAGRLGDRRGRRPIIVGGALLVAVSVLGYLVAGTVPAIVGLRFVTGIGEAFFFVGAASAIADMAPEERLGEALSLFSLALYAGIGLGPIFGEAAVEALGFRAAWVGAAALAAVAGLLGLAVPETRAHGEEEAGTDRPLIHRGAIRPGVILWANLVAMAGYFAFLPLYSRVAGLEGSRLIFLLFSAVVIAVRSAGARVPDRIGPRRASMGALISTAVGMLTLASWPDAGGVVAGTAVLAVGQALAFPALMTLAMRGVPASERGSLVGTFTAFVEVAFGLGPVLLGFVAEGFGFRGAFLASGIVALGGLLLLPPARERATAAAKG